MPIKSDFTIFSVQEPRILPIQFSSPFHLFSNLIFNKMKRRNRTHADRKKNSAYVAACFLPPIEPFLLATNKKDFKILLSKASKSLIDKSTQGFLLPNMKQ